MTETTRAGYVALIGLPNAGKSSLLNRLLGTKLSIVTPLAQTTRERVVGIDTRDQAQMIFLDTPGIVDPAYLLHYAMSGIVEEAIADADVIVLLLDGTRPPPPLADEVVATLRQRSGRLLVVINKSDLADETHTRELRAWSVERLGVVPEPISASTGSGIEDLRTRIADLLPESPFLFPDDEMSTQTVRFFVAELVRETVFELYQEEIPYSVATKVDEFREDSDPIVIRTTIYVERPSQKAILIGKGGAAIRDLGIQARAKIEEFLDQRVFLQLWVKVLPKWRKSPLELRRLGFPVPQDRQ
jgi:GTP-binding protein Era